MTLHQKPAPDQLWNQPTPPPRNTRKTRETSGENRLQKPRLPTTFQNRAEGRGLSAVGAGGWRPSCTAARAAAAATLSPSPPSRPASALNISAHTPAVSHTRDTNPTAGTPRPGRQPQRTVTTRTAALLRIDVKASFGQKLGSWPVTCSSRGTTNLPTRRSPSSSSATCSPRGHPVRLLEDPRDGYTVEVGKDNGCLACPVRSIDLLEEVAASVTNFVELDYKEKDEVPVEFFLKADEIPVLPFLHVRAGQGTQGADGSST